METLTYMCSDKSWAVTDCAEPWLAVYLLIGEGFTFSFRAIKYIQTVDKFLK